MKERVSHASFKLQAQLEKLEHMYSRLQQRDRDLFQRCVGAQVSKDIPHAKIYANECAEIRKIAKVVLGSQLALEKVILRLETVEEFGDIMAHIAPVMGIVKETKSKIAGIVPQVAGELEEVNDLLGDLTAEAGEVTSSEVSIETSDDEAKKVLEETGLIAEQRLRDHFPDLPSLDQQTPEVGQGVPELATHVIELDGKFEDRVYDYARRNSGELSIQSCARELGASTEDVKTAIERLRETGRIVIE